MQKKHRRHPLKNFFIHPVLQWDHIRSTLLLGTLIIALTSGIIGWVYYARFDSGSFYFMTPNLNENLTPHSIWGIIMPGAIFAEILVIFLSLVSGLYGSRKISVPVYKTMQWAKNMSEGNVSSRLYFREKERYQDLAKAVNEVSEKVETLIEGLKSDLIGKKNLTDDDLEQIQSRLREYTFKSPV